MTICTRFAPSPTGFLHIGGARTALFAWAYARSKGGKFLLRIEDTDQERSTQEATDAILSAMDWLGLDYDAPLIYQSQRIARYQEVVSQLISDGYAYKCYCSKERLQKLREEQMAAKQKPKYDGYCKQVPPSDPNAPYVVRFRQQSEGETIVDDKLHGRIHFDNRELDDLILLRQDGAPTYHLSVVVDDADMDITHVIRGDDHLTNTPRQINLLRAMGKPIPQYIHLPMILGPDGKRFSKRHGAQNVLEYKNNGFLPEALINYLIRLGWSHGNDEIFSVDEIKKLFNVEHLNKSAAAFNLEKLTWLNQHYIKTTAPEKLIPIFKKHLKLANENDFSDTYFATIIEAQKDRAKDMVELAEKSQFFFAEGIDHYDEKAVSKHLKPEIMPTLTELVKTLAVLTDWDDESIQQVIVKFAKKHELKLGKIAQPIRIAVTGNTVSPSINVLLRILGKEKTLARLHQLLEHYS